MARNQQKKVAAYVRVSGPGQVGEDAFGPDIQRNAIKAFALSQGWEIVKVYECPEAYLLTEFFCKLIIVADFLVVIPSILVHRALGKIQRIRKKLAQRTFPNTNGSDKNDI
jgi:hypothetical protein